MNCSRFFGLLLIGSLSVLPISALEIEQVWEVSLPEGQSYMRANIAWSPSDSLPHLFAMGREDLTVYHMTPGSEFEPVLTLPDYPGGGIVCFGVCLDSTWESSVLVHYRYLNADTGRVVFVNLPTGDSLFSSDPTIHYLRDVWCDFLEFWWQPSSLFCSGAGNGMMAHLYGSYREDYDVCDILHHYAYGTRNRGYSIIWSARDFQLQNSGGMSRIQSDAFCLMGSDTILDWVASGRLWGAGYQDEWGYTEWEWRNTIIAFRREGWNAYWIAEDTGTVKALERADGPAWGLLFFCNDSMTYYQRGPTHVWSIPSSVPIPTLAVAFPRRLLPQRVALVYSGTSLMEIDLLDGHAVETIEAPPNVRMLQPYLAQDGSWELMAVFDRSGRGYRVTGLLPVNDDANPVLPQLYSLQAYPNPFNEAVKIAYELPRTESVRVHVMDVLGREVALLLDEVKVAGKHELIWNPKSLASGIYFICLRTESTRRVNKLVHVK
jgi:hypothetical protein